MVAVSGALMAAGLALVAAQGAAALAGISTTEGFVGEGDVLEASSELEAGATGVYAVVSDGVLEAVLEGPSTYEEVTSEGGAEEFFEVAESGTYTITVSGGADRVQAMAAIGEAPGDSRYLGTAAGLVLASGMAMLAFIGARVMIRRRQLR